MGVLNSMFFVQRNFYRGIFKWGNLELIKQNLWGLLVDTNRPLYCNMFEHPQVHDNLLFQLVSFNLDYLSYYLVLLLSSKYLVFNK